MNLSRWPQIFHQYSSLIQFVGGEKKLGIGIARGESERERERERVANQNIDGLWLFALIVILTGAARARSGGKPAGVEIRRRRWRSTNIGSVCCDFLLINYPFPSRYLERKKGRKNH